MKKLGVTLLVCLVLVMLTSLTNVVVAAADLGGTDSGKITTTDPIVDPIVDPEPDGCTQDDDPYWDDDLTP